MLKTAITEMFGIKYPIICRELLDRIAAEAVVSAKKTKKMIREG